MATDERDDEFISVFTDFLRTVTERQQSKPAETTPLGGEVEAFIGTNVSALPLVTESIPAHRLVDADIALDLVSGDSGRLIGVTGGQQRQHEEFPQLLTRPYASFDVGPVEYTSAATGPDTQRRIVSFGVRLLRFEGEPVAVLQRGPAPQFGREHATLEVLTPSPDTCAAFLAAVRRLMQEHSVLRGKLLSFTGNPFEPSASGATFLSRPEVAADDIVLSPGTLDRVVSHVVGIGRQRERLVAAGQHLKRGILLYGPPGTGKTLTVRHLLSETDGVTGILLTGTELRFINEAAEVARAMQPSIVVLEDVDLVAGDRGMFDGPQPLLFALLDALDGVDGDSDVAFVLTTNRADVLEPALAQRPGRVDLAVEIPLPDSSARRRLFRLYAAGLAFTDDGLDAAADAAEGTTGSFAKEAVRRAVLRAAIADRDADDADLAEVLDAMMSEAEQVTRSLLGSGREPASGGPDDDGASFGYGASLGSGASFGDVTGP